MSRRPNRVTRPRTTPVWEPPAHIQGLFPAVSGNDINGLGEDEARRPQLIMWAHPKSIAHGPVQEHMTAEFLAHPELRSVLRMDDGFELPPVAAASRYMTPGEWGGAIARFVLEDSPHPVELVGATPIDPSWFYEGRETDHTTAIVLGLSLIHI